MYDRILVPIALDHASSAEASLEIAQSLIKSGGEITVLNVIEDIPTFAQNYLPEGTLEANQIKAVETLNALAHKGGHNYIAEVIHGKPAVAILEYAKKIDADCIVIASHKPGLEDYFIGSTAARVVRHATCCVHVLR
ncbi:universal stress protein [Planktotalea sp.]|uniref:universal stress protein n=1 Tax=Planktotalea sp. TaxID=2029877 RepID=UPI003D6BF94E